MIYYLPPPEASESGDRRLTTHDLVNEKVAPLHVISMGVAGSTAYFRRFAAAEGSDEVLAGRIFEQLLTLAQVSPGAKRALDTISEIAILK